MLNERYGPYEGCFPIKPTLAKGDGAPDRFATPFIVTDADRIANLDRIDAQEALERHLATLERQVVTTDPIAGVVVQNESGAVKAGPSDGPVWSPSYRIGSDGKVYGRRSCGIAGSQTPDGYPLSVHPYVVGTGETAIQPRMTGRRGELADLGTFGSKLGQEMDRRRTLITRPEQPDRYRLARVNGLDRLANVWARENGCELEPVIGSDFIAAHEMFSLSQTVAVDADGNAVDLAGDVAVWRNGNLDDNARAMYGGFDITRWNGAALVTVDGYRIVADRYGYDDTRHRGRGKVTLRTAARKLRLPSMTTLARHAERLHLDSEPVRHPRTGDVLVTRTGKVRLRFYRQAADGRRVYVSPADTLITRRTVDATETRDASANRQPATGHHPRLTHRTPARTVTTTTPSGNLRLARDGDRSAVIALTDAAVKRTETARKAAAVKTPDAELAIRDRLQQMANGETVPFGSVVVTRRAADGRYVIKGSDTRYRTVTAAARAVARGGQLAD